MKTALVIIRKEYLLNENMWNTPALTPLSFNIESELFNQLTKEQQALWRKEIEPAVISGGEVGVGLARDPRYKENLEMKDTFIKKATT